MKKITREELLIRLTALRGAAIVGLTVDADDPARYKADRGRVTKVSTFSVMLNAQYDKAKAKKLGVTVPEVSIEAKKWRKRICKSPILQHTTNGTKYVEGLFLSGSTEYTLDGKPATRTDVAALLKPSGSNPQAVPYRTPKVENITHAKINGEEYEIV